MCRTTIADIAENVLYLKKIINGKYKMFKFANMKYQDSKMLSAYFSVI